MYLSHFPQAVIASGNIKNGKNLTEQMSQTVLRSAQDWVVGGRREGRVQMPSTPHSKYHKKHLFHYKCYSVLCREFKLVKMEIKWKCGRLDNYVI